VKVAREWVVGLCVAVLLGSAPASAADVSASISIRAGKADSTYHMLARQFAEAVATGDNALTLVVEESQGSVQNIIDAPHRGTNYIFTAPPNLIAQAKRGNKPFKRNSHYSEIRALFPIPPQTMHWVVRADSGITNFARLAGRPFVPGAKGSIGERQTTSALHALGLDGRVQLIDIDAAGAQAALTGNQVIGIAISGTYPVPAVADLARATPIRLLGLSQEELAKVLAVDHSMAAQIVPKDTYQGVKDDVLSVALPAGAYTTERMRDDIAYAVTKAFWSQKADLTQRNPPWSAVTPGSLAALGIKLHRGALRYYKEAGIEVPAALR
jgi:uncharacterized protein